MADLNSIANSTYSVVISRLVIVILPFLLALLGWLVADKLETIGKDQVNTWAYVGRTNEVVAKTSETLSDIKTNIAVGNAAYLNHVKSDDAFEVSVKALIADHEMRLRAANARSAPPSQ